MIKKSCLLYLGLILLFALSACGNKETIESKNQNVGSPVEPPVSESSLQNELSSTANSEVTAIGDNYLPFEMSDLNNHSDLPEIDALAGSYQIEIPEEGETIYLDIKKDGSYTSYSEQKPSIENAGAYFNSEGKINYSPDFRYIGISTGILSQEYGVYTLVDLVSIAPFFDSGIKSLDENGELIDKPASKNTFSAANLVLENFDPDTVLQNSNSANPASIKVSGESISYNRTSYMSDNEEHVATRLDSAPIEVSKSVFQLVKDIVKNKPTEFKSLNQFYQYIISDKTDKVYEFNLSNAQNGYNMDGELISNIKYVFRLGDSEDGSITIYATDGKNIYAHGVDPEEVRNYTEQPVDRWDLIENLGSGDITQ